MCGRFIDPDQLSLDLDLDRDLNRTKINPIPRRYNIKPTQEIYVVVGDSRPALARWGLIPIWHKGELKDWKAATINARIETAADLPTFRAAWKYGRCLIPAGGYYEWTGDRTPKQPHFFQSAGNEATLWFAGLMSLWRDELLTAAIMTRAANSSVEPIHDRMPVILNTAEREAWLAGSTDLDIGAGAQVRHHPVRPFGIRDEGERLIEAQ